MSTGRLRSSRHVRYNSLPLMQLEQIRLDQVANGNGGYKEHKSTGVNSGMQSANSGARTPIAAAVENVKRTAANYVMEVGRKVAPPSLAAGVGVSSGAQRYDKLDKPLLDSGPSPIPPSTQSSANFSPFNNDQSAFNPGQEPHNYPVVNEIRTSHPHPSGDFSTIPLESEQPTPANDAESQRYQYPRHTFTNQYLQDGAGDMAGGINNPGVSIEEDDFFDESLNSPPGFLGARYHVHGGSRKGLPSVSPGEMVNGDLSHGEPAYFRRSRIQSTTMSVCSTATTTRGAVISYHNISYSVKTKKFPWSKPITKHILTDISGIMKPGMNAIMGPTGSGKSSLLDVLARRKNPAFLEGSVLVDGEIQPENFKCVSGYVVQDDIVMGTLTVRENLRFSAALRLPQKWSDAERKDKVENILKELGLAHVADTKVGTELIRGVSGGERKRTSIAMELITDPSVLFLDEPTTGLDAATAASVIKTLRALSTRGRTIIFSLHQPKYSIYKLFHALTLVYKGRCVYQGPADSIPLEYFRTIGYVCEAFNNPADFFLDILHGEAKPIDHAANAIVQNNDDNASLSGIEAVIANEPEPELQHKLVKAWEESSQSALLRAELDGIHRAAQVDKGDHISLRKSSNLIEYRTSFCKQLGHVSWRTLLNLFRNPQGFLVQLAVYFVFCLFDGIIYLQMDTSTESGFQNRNGLFFFMMLQMTFINIASVDIFIRERPLFIHENMSGYYRVSVYFLTKVFCDLIPVRFMAILLFGPVVYFMSALRVDAGAFFIFEVLFFIITTVGCSIAFFYSASVSIMDIGNMLVSITFVFMMVFSGNLINIKSMGDWLNWCRYLSAFRYTGNALSINEYKYLEFCPKKSNDSCILGTTYLRDQGIFYEKDVDLWVNVIALVIMAMFFLVLAYIQLRRMNKYK